MKWSVLLSGLINVLCFIGKVIGLVVSSDRRGELLTRSGRHRGSAVLDPDGWKQQHMVSAHRQFIS